MILGKRGETWPKKVMNGPINGSGNDTNSGLLSTGGVVKKTSFERDFPSLGAEEREVGLFPGLSSAIQSLTIGTSATIGGEKWTSALAEVPIRAQTAPQLSYGTQRLEELAIKQSRQLIPVTPSMPKTLTSSSSDKQKSRANPQHHPISSSLTLNHSPRGGSVKGDVSKPSNVGKIQFPKPAPEKNGATTVVKDNLSPKSGGPPNNVAPECKPILTALEKRPTCQAQSRNDFFNSVRKKSIANTSSIGDSSESPFFSDKLFPDTPIGDHLSEEISDSTCNGDVEKCVVNGKKHSGFGLIISEEEETAFLRSLGWEESNEEGGRTEEEISGFYRDVAKYIDSKPSLRLPQGIQTKFLAPFESQIGGSSGISSGLDLSDNAKLET